MEKYYKELPSDYVEVYRIDGSNKKVGLIMNLMAIIISFSLLVIGIFIFTSDVSIELDKITIYLWIFLLSMILYLVLHELTHGIAYKLLTKQKLKFGLSWSCAYCGIPNIYVSKRTAIISLLAPFIIYSIGFLIPVFFIKNIYLKLMIYSLFSLHVGGCVGDLYDFILLTFKFKNTVLMNDTGPEQRFYDLKKEN